MKNIGILVFMLIPLLCFSQDQGVRGGCTILGVSSYSESEQVKFRELMPDIQKIESCKILGFDAGIIRGFGAIEWAYDGVCYYEVANLSSLLAGTSGSEHNTSLTLLYLSGNDNFGQCESVSYTSSGISLSANYYTLDELIDVYKNEIDILVNCISQRDCLEEFIGTYSFFGKILNSSFRDFRYLIENGGEIQGVESVQLWSDSKEIIDIYIDVSGQLWRLEVDRSDGLAGNKLLSIGYVEQ